MTTQTVDLTSLLDKLDEDTKHTLSTVPAVEVAGEDFTSDGIPSAAAAKWTKIDDVVVVVCDLRSSAKLGVGKHATSTARIYKSGVEGAVKVLHDFGADFIDIQGDGGFGVFWGPTRFERAICAAVTVRKFSDAWVERLASKWPDGLPETGYKVGIASGKVLVKHLGTRNNGDESEPVWAGRPVNYAAKCAQAATAGQIVATNAAWEQFSKNDFIAYSCVCGPGEPSRLWDDTIVETLPDGDEACVLLESTWCDACGPSFCAAVLAGNKKRDDVNETRRAKEMEGMLAALAIKKRQDKKRRYLA